MWNINVQRHIYHPSGSCFLDNNLHKTDALQNIWNSLETCSESLSCALKKSKQCLSGYFIHTFFFFFDSILSEGCRQEYSLKCQRKKMLINLHASWHNVFGILVLTRLFEHSMDQLVQSWIVCCIEKVCYFVLLLKDISGILWK